MSEYHVTRLQEFQLHDRKSGPMHNIIRHSRSRSTFISMASPRCLIRPARELSIRTRPQVLKRKLLPLAQNRYASDQPRVSQVPEGTKGPNEDQLPHVSEEQAAMDKIMGDTPPDITQGTPVKDVSVAQYHTQRKRTNIVSSSSRTTKTPWITHPKSSKIR